MTIDNKTHIVDIEMSTVSKYEKKYIQLFSTIQIPTTAEEVEMAKYEASNFKDVSIYQY